MSGKKVWRIQPQGMSDTDVLPFVCLGSECPSTCCGPFHGTRALEPTVTRAQLGVPVDGDDPSGDHVSVFAEIQLTSTDVRRLQEGGHDHLIVRRDLDGEITYYMKLAPDGSCSALSPDRLCRIHPFRPTLCRAFPFYVDLFAGLTMVASCPGVGAGEQPVRDLQRELEACRDMYTFWLTRLEPR